MGYRFRLQRPRSQELSFSDGLSTSRAYNREGGAKNIKGIVANWVRLTAIIDSYYSDSMMELPFMPLDAASSGVLRS
jgi:hypothetical protein